MASNVVAVADHSLSVNKSLSEVDQKEIAFGFTFDTLYVTEWMKNHWNIPIYATIFYLVLIFSLQKYMSSRKPFDLRGPLVTWNVMLAAYSIVTTIYSFEELFFLLQKHSFSELICYKKFITAVPLRGLLCFLFALSKMAEFIDTVFIVLRKRKLIFLHWYHHTSANLLAWYLTSELSGSGVAYGIINGFVHSIMYSYFSLKAMNYYVPERVSMIITFIQIMQMAAAIALTLYMYTLKFSGGHCETNYISLNAILYTAMSFLLLFSRFFYQKYLVTSEKRVKCDKED